MLSRMLPRKYDCKPLSVLLVILAYGGIVLPASAQNADEAAEATSQIMKLRLGVSGPDNEWVRFEMDSGETGDIILRAYHTTRVRRTFLSELTTGLLSFGAEELMGGETTFNKKPDVNA